MTGFVKKLLVFIVAINAMFLSGCFVGRTGPEGASLRKYLKPDSLKALTENPRDEIWIVDVRPKSAYNSGHIPTARSYPSSEILKRIDEIPKGKYLILYCETGGRAQRVLNDLKKIGYKRLMNWGSYRRWRWEYER